jgi:filamentous hemagglutinin family protein
MTVALSAYGDVTLDGTLGRAGALPGPNYAITADLGRQVGGNLFHSFGQFSINTGESATFSGPNSVSNIIGRVTGGNVSFIDGALRSTIPGANLYLLNPAGVLFGEHAQLDVPGSFHGSTADYLRLSDGGRFDARTPGNSVLTVAPVEAFGFLGDAPGRIDINGSFLQVPEGQTLSLIGGDITLTNATLYAPAGRINLASVGSAGEVIPTDADLAMPGFGRLGTLTMERDPTVERIKMDRGGPLGERPLADLDTSGEGGGAIFIRGEQWFSQGGRVYADTYGAQAGQDINILVSDAVTLQSGGAIRAFTLAEGDAGSVTISARNLRVDGQGSHGRTGITSNAFTGITSSAGPDSTGAGGDVHLTVAETLSLFNGGQIEAGTYAEGDAGSVTISARNLRVDGQGLELLSTSGIASIAYPGSTGAGGDVHLTVAETLSLRNGGVIAAVTFAEGDAGSVIISTRNLSIFNSGGIAALTFAEGDAGSVTISARNLVVDGQGSSGSWAWVNHSDTGITSSAVGPNSTGAGGDVHLTVAETLSLFNGCVIDAGTWGAGDAGSVTISARNLVVDGNGLELFSSSAITSNAYPGSTGAGGDVHLTVAETLSLRNGGAIAAGTWGEGDAGSVTINACHLVVDGQGLELTGISSGTFPDSTGAGGDAHLTVAETLSVLNGGGISVASLGAGNAGDLTITARHLNLANSSSISAISEHTTGGNLFINAEHLKLLDGSEISSSVAGNELSEGGNVTLNSTNVVALNGSRITAQANQGQGGNIILNAEVFLHDAASVDEVLNASSQVAGNDGTVQNNAPTTDISGSLTALPARYLNAADRLSHRCGMGDPDSRSRFTVQGRGALPPGPDEPATTPATGCRSEPLALAHATPPASVITATPTTITSGFGDR